MLSARRSLTPRLCLSSASRGRRPAVARRSLARNLALFQWKYVSSLPPLLRTRRQERGRGQPRKKIAVAWWYAGSFTTIGRVLCKGRGLSIYATTLAKRANRFLSRLAEVRARPVVWHTVVPAVLRKPEVSRRSGLICSTCSFFRSTSILVNPAILPIVRLANCDVKSSPCLSSNGTCRG